MNWINDAFGTELSQTMQLAILFVGLIIALFIVFWLFRSVFRSAGPRPSRNRKARIGVIEAAIVDDTRRLVLVRRDHVEHLLMIGGPSDVVVESGIGARPLQPAAQPAIQPVPAQPAPTAPMRAEPVAQRAEPAAQRPEPVAARQPEPVARPAPVAIAAAASSVAAPVAAVASEAGDRLMREEPPSAAPASASSPAMPQAVEQAAEPIMEKAADSAPALSAELRSELASEAGDNAASVAPSVESDASPANTDDDMQRLLDELAGEKR